VLWGIERSLDEHLWLGEDGRVGSDLVQVAGVLLVVGGAVILLRTRARWVEWLRSHHSGDEDQGVPAADTEHTKQRAQSEASEQAEQRA